MKKIAIGIVMALALAVASACGGGSETAKETTDASAPAAAAPALTPGDAYVCSMHPDVKSGTPGRCPICGMNLVARPAAAASTNDTAQAAPAAETSPAAASHAGCPGGCEAGTCAENPRCKRAGRGHCAHGHGRCPMLD